MKRKGKLIEYHPLKRVSITEHFPAELYRENRHVIPEWIPLRQHICLSSLSTCGNYSFKH